MRTAILGLLFGGLSVCHAQVPDRVIESCRFELVKRNISVPVHDSLLSTPGSSTLVGAALTAALDSLDVRDSVRISVDQATIYMTHMGPAYPAVGPYEVGHILVPGPSPEYILECQKLKIAMEVDDRSLLEKLGEVLFTTPFEIIELTYRRQPVPAREKDPVFNAVPKSR